MAGMMASNCKDFHFGPIIKGCRDDFDFTILFEDTILGILPSILALLASSVRIFYLRAKPTLLGGRHLQLGKLFAIAVYGALQTSTLALWTQQHSDEYGFSTAAAAIAAFNAAVFGVLSYFEHSKSRRPSTVLLVYLLFSALCDSARIRTMWLVDPGSGLTSWFTVASLFKIVLIVLEAIEKRRYLPWSEAKRTPEDYSSIYSRSVFWWLNGLLWIGIHRGIKMDDMYALPNDVKADYVAPKFALAWQRAQLSGQKHISVRALAHTLRWAILGAVLPRIILLLLTVSTPIILNELLSFLEDPHASSNTGLGLIGGFALVYVAIALSGGLYWYNTYRSVSMVRACLVTAIASKTGRINVYKSIDSKAALTLMSADVERITEGLANLHEFWADIVQVGIATYLLQRQIGFACFIPVVIALSCAGCSFWMSSIANARFKVWMAAVQVRISAVSEMLGSVRGVKMMGLERTVGATLTNLRVEELAKASAYRLVNVWSALLSFTPELLSPALTFLAFIIRSPHDTQAMSATRVFTSLSLLNILAQPLSSTLQFLPMLVAAVGSLGRIDSYLESDEHQDFRRPYGSLDGDYSTSASLRQDQAIELTHLPRSSVVESEPNDDHILEVLDGAFGYAEDAIVIQGINACIPRGKLTFVIGPVASGKSTFCKALIGQLPEACGNVMLDSQTTCASFCDQPAFVRHGSIKDNIVAFSPWDRAWYESVVSACALDEDIRRMPDGDMTILETGGTRLSGGQKQKLTLARAVYARNRIMVLDDILSGMDAKSEQHVFREVLGREGLAGRHSIATVLATHSLKHLPQADHIIAFGTEGAIEYEGPYDTLPARLRPMVSSEACRRPSTEVKPTSPAMAALEDDPKDAQPLERKAEIKAQGFAVYKFYFKAAGLWLLASLVTIGIADATFFTVPTYWLDVWTRASSQPGYPKYLYAGVYLLLELVALALLGWFCSIALLKMVKRTGQTIHDSLLHTVLNAPWSFLATTDTGTIVNRFSQDIQLIDGDLAGGLLNVCLTFCLSTGQIILIIISSPWIGLAFPPILVILYVVQNYYVRTSRQLRILDLEAKSPLYTSFGEMVSGIATLRAQGWIDNILDQIGSQLEKSQEPLYLLYMVQRWLTFVLDMIVAGVAVLVVTISVHTRAQSGLTGVALTQVMSLNLMLRGLIVAWTRTETSISAVARVRDFQTSTVSEHQQQEILTPPIDWPQAGSLTFNRLSASFGISGRRVLRELDFTIKAGEKVGICGRSGSGKTSTLLAILHIIDYVDGSVEIDGIDLADIPRHEVRNRINVVTQDPFALPGTVRTNLDPDNIHTDSALSEALTKVGLWQTVESKGGLAARLSFDTWSSGQRQLFCLARAILRRCKIVVLDEITSNVDTETDAQMQRIVREEFKGCTIIAVAHRLNTILDFDRIGVFDAGRLCELDTPEALMARPSMLTALLSQGSEQQEN